MIRALFVALTLTACAQDVRAGDPTHAASQASHRDVDVGALHDALKAAEKPVLIDVRTPGEYAEGHVPGAKNIPLDTIGSHADELKGDQEVWLVCRSGSRSARAASLLNGQGVRTVNVQGGTLAWQAAGYPVE
ncbi:MAG: rhodanese-like domain-containing protein [Alphaproteobacteria bacterium]|nr:rhodanese-like domain-containing protein [Alphaproteobacteria bacterium]MCB9692725.1 rhodanese-like domain-containing protein [Alphaproteobacteria bacterium]